MKLQVIVTRRPQYGCRACEGAVVQALAPDRPITGGMATPGFPSRHRQIIRNRESLPVVDDLKPWLQMQHGHLSTKSKLAEAIAYALTRWDGFTLFLDDGRIEPDTNVLKRAIRPIVLTRKNALFAGSDPGAVH